MRSRSAARMVSTMTRAVRSTSRPGFRMTALADLMASEVICVMASGRASKMTASRPSGQLTFSSSRPVVEFGAFENAADGVGQSGDGAHAFDHGREACRGGEHQAIDKSAATSSPRTSAARLRRRLRRWRRGFRRAALLERAGDASRAPDCAARWRWRRCMRAACLAACGERCGWLSLTAAFPGEEKRCRRIRRRRLDRERRACGRWR